MGVACSMFKSPGALSSSVSSDAPKSTSTGVSNVLLEIANATDVLSSSNGHSSVSAVGRNEAKSSAKSAADVDVGTTSSDPILDPVELVNWINNELGTNGPTESVTRARFGIF
jgi:hypothetical protein